MGMRAVIKLIKLNFKLALLFGMLFGAFSFLFLVTTQKNFCSSADVLISQNQLGTDYYSLSQSANYLTNILTQSMYSEKFLDEVEAKSNFPTTFLSNNKVQQIKKWQKIIQIKNNSHLGIMYIKVFGNTQYQTKKLSEAVLDILVNHNSFFLGQDHNITVRVLSGPIVEKNPSFLQIVITSISGFIVGILFFLFFLIYREEYKKQENGQIEFIQKKTIDEDSYTNNIYPIEKDQTIKENQEDNYLSADSEYWKKRLEDNQNKF